MGPHGIAVNTSQHETTINCILRGSRRGLCLEQTMPFIYYYRKQSQIISASNDI